MISITSEPVLRRVVSCIRVGTICDGKDLTCKQMILQYYWED